MPALRRENLAADPIVQFHEWYVHARAEVPLAEAMTLATVDADGAPDARMVLLKGVDDEGFRFFTNYESEKAEQLETAPGGGAALVIYWRELDRQVRVRGAIERLSAAESDAYFATRPHESRLAAWASPQSRSVDSRDELDDRLAAAAARFERANVPRPDHWGGYLLRPRTIEFWQGQVARMHDRFRYSRDGEGWRVERLGP
jgi:pyridoxamine 5'-phosphate oxidase